MSSKSQTMVRENSSIALSTSPGRFSPIIRTNESIKKVKGCFNRRKKVNSRKLAVQLDISRTSLRRMLKNDLLLRPSKKIVEPLLPDERRQKRTKMFTKREDTMKILLSEEKLFDIDGIYNFPDDRIWAVSRVEADKRGDIKKKRKCDGLVGCVSR